MKLEILVLSENQGLIYFVYQFSIQFKFTQ